jgi:hypothetical protein
MMVVLFLAASLSSRWHLESTTTTDGVTIKAQTTVGEIRNGHQSKWCGITMKEQQFFEELGRWYASGKPLEECTMSCVERQKYQFDKQCSRAP